MVAKDEEFKQESLLMDSCIHSLPIYPLYNCFFFFFRIPPSRGVFKISRKTSLTRHGRNEGIACLPLRPRKSCWHDCWMVCLLAAGFPSSDLGWLAGWLVGWLVGGWVGWLVGWLVGKKTTHPPQGWTKKDGCGGSHPEKWGGVV